MRFLIDAQLPPALARWLRGNGHDAEHVFDIGLLGGSDHAIADYARRVGAVVVSKDEDFLGLLGAAGPSLVWVKVGNVANAQLIAKLSPLWADVCARIEEGERVVELR